MYHTKILNPDSWVKAYTLPKQSATLRKQELTPSSPWVAMWELQSENDVEDSWCCTFAYGWLQSEQRISSPSVKKPWPTSEASQRPHWKQSLCQWRSSNDTNFVVPKPERTIDMLLQGMLQTVLGQNGSGQNVMDKMLRTKCYGQNGIWTKWYTDKMVFN